MKFFNLLRLVIDAAVCRRRAASYSINRAAGNGKVGPGPHQLLADKFFSYSNQGGADYAQPWCDKLVSTIIFDITASLN